MSTLYYPLDVRDSTIGTGDNRVTGLTITVSAVKTMAASPATVSTGTVTMIEVGLGAYIAAYDPETNGDAIAALDCGATLSSGSDRYINLVMTRESGRILGSLNATGLTVKKNTALAKFTFPIMNPTDHLTPKTGLTVTGTVVIDGASAAPLTNAISEIDTSGIYNVDLAAADTNGNVLTFVFTATGGDTRVMTVVTQP